MRLPLSIILWHFGFLFSSLVGFILVVKSFFKIVSTFSKKINAVANNREKHHIGNGQKPSDDQIKCFSIYIHFPHSLQRSIISKTASGYLEEYITKKDY